MQHEDTRDDIDARIPARPPSHERIRGRLHGGWVVMVLAGLLAGLANLAILRGDGPTARVAVLAQDAAPGTPVPGLPLRFLPVDADRAALESVVTRAVVGASSSQVLAQHLPAGTILRRGDLRAPGEDVPQAMSLPIEPARAVAGDLTTGDVVDVIADDAGGGAAYLVRGVTVLATTGSLGGLGVAPSATSVTLAVDEEQALLLARALRAGDLDIIRVTAGGGGAAS